MRSISLVAALAFGVTHAAAADRDIKRQVDAYVASHQAKIMAELVEALSIPDVASDTANIRKKAELLRGLFQKRGFAASLIETAGNPLVYAEKPNPRAKRTLLLYAHYDGQPVDPKLWKQASPFRPVLRDGRLENGAKELALSGHRRFEPDWRLYARSASDDTSPIVALLAAVDALDAAGLDSTSKLKVILDGEEEAGSPSLIPAVQANKDRLACDLLLILDGPVHPSERATLVYGARGILTVELTVYGPKAPLHSGHYGNWVPNPALRLAQLIAALKDGEGRATVAGFYDGITLTPEDRAAMSAVPDDEAALKRAFGIADTDKVGASLQEALQYPSLNVRGLRSAYVGEESRTIIPDRATAAIDLRLVKETPSDALYQKLVTHIGSLGWHVVAEDPDDATRAAHPRILKVARVEGGSEAYRTDLDNPQAKALFEALSRELGEPPVRLRTSGGTVPIEPFVRLLGVPAVSVPIVNYDNNQHAENENVRLGHVFRGIAIIAVALTM